VAVLTTEAAAPFLARLLRLDPAALVRLRGVADDQVAMWGRVPWGVLVTRRVPGPALADVTVAADALLRAIADGDGNVPPARDADWRWGLPSSEGTLVEDLPAATVYRLGAAAAEALRAGRGRVGDRALRDALLDHVPIVVTTADGELPVRQGLVQALLRMGFMGTDEDGQVAVRRAGGWVGLAARHGSVWLQNRTTQILNLAR
jgi:hypothetical protein